MGESNNDGTGMLAFGVSKDIPEVLVTSNDNLAMIIRSIHDFPISGPAHTERANALDGIAMLLEHSVCRSWEIFVDEKARHASRW